MSRPTDAKPHDLKPESLLPLSSAVYGVLLALGESTLHGYAIIQEFERKTGQVTSKGARIFFGGYDGL